MDIPVNAKVTCADGACGQSIYVIVNPITQQVTHLVVKEKGFPYMSRIVPVALVVESTPRLIRLSCTKSQLAILKPFLELEHIREDRPHFNYEADEYRRWPYVTPEKMPIPAEMERIHPDELVIRRGTQVKATDGRVGKVTEFLVDPTDGHITHLVLREGHVWDQKDVTIPIAHIDHIEENTVYLKLDKLGVEALPVIPVRRH